LHPKGSDVKALGVTLPKVGDAAMKTSFSSGYHDSPDNLFIVKYKDSAMALSQMLHPTKRMTMSWRLGLLSLAVMFAGPLQAATTHDQRYTALAIDHPALGSIFKPDPYQWVVTSAFAKQFGMPERWVDDSLMGAEAIAYKIVTNHNPMCGFFSDANACIPIQSCFFDFYVKKEANLPWKDESPHGIRQLAGHLSTFFLNHQNKEQKQAYDENFPNNNNRYGAGVGIDYLYFVDSYNEKTGTGYELGLSPQRVQTFDRTYAYGMDFFSVNNCTKLNQVNKGLLELVIKEAPVLNNMPTQYYEAKRTGIPHRHLIKFPKAFVKKLYKYHKKNEGNDLVDLAKDRLKLGE